MTDDNYVPVYDTPVAWLCGWGETRWVVWTPTIQHARIAAQAHAGNDRAWVRLATHGEAQEWQATA